MILTEADGHYRDLAWMTLALDYAARGAIQGEVPVGAVLLGADGHLLAAAHNTPVQSHDPSAHAEMLVLRQAAQVLQNYRLTGATLYVTLEPCVMCIGAMLHARVARLVYAASDPKTGAVESLYHLLEDGRFNHRIVTEGGVLAAPSATLLRNFFRARRRGKGAGEADVATAETGVETGQRSGDAALQS
ncbi:tRNA-specific adenosine deaminase [Acidithiobacillus ferrivorans]|uniref:tRNA-specific adenosine deaminase n=1 Tax=Acidithiobacillus ferrivorans TaxID=160808 RepID=A0A060V030_9PROT|nr:tRNA adenosine(34) deaminase TadA [Acidithiobacillus ferrivorans]CDQ12268.1 Zinc-binding CMP/dCMP deaminase [Acidithiobacillus ferrivorans]SMH65188.1 tRNA-specific adenosine deaminase [Acidithiobacillus ferrivorans]